ncbi:MAG: twin-arginine translocase TatA/TatE family subunit [Deltaproteobacteria bacterium]|nr:twin-arginine translocase TatA/TatE family subunit [Deltaproteobacteria bacterium]MBW2266380.1 twin-arginine translocase TatA/TatE family subunit [Deltaproteobacteria bacterium]
MFGMGMPEIILILAIALIVLGPKKLPDIAKSLGKGIAEFKKATQDFKQSIEVDNDFKEAKNTLQDIKGDIQQTVHQSMAQGAASLNDEDKKQEQGIGKDDDPLPEASSEANTEQPHNQETDQDIKESSQQAEQEAEEKGPSKDA